MHCKITRILEYKSSKSKKKIVNKNIKHILDSRYNTDLCIKLKNTKNHIFFKNTKTCFCKNIFSSTSIFGLNHKFCYTDSSIF